MQQWEQPTARAPLSAFQYLFQRLAILHGGNLPRAHKSAHDGADFPNQSTVVGAYISHQSAVCDAVDAAL